MVKPLEGKVALVTGAGRGIGKGVALGLGEAGAIVYIIPNSVEQCTLDYANIGSIPNFIVQYPTGFGISGRTVSEENDSSKGTIYQTAQQVNKLGGKGIAVRCDHRHDDEVTALFKQLEEESGGKLYQILVGIVH